MVGIAAPAPPERPHPIPQQGGRTQPNHLYGANVPGVHRIPRRSARAAAGRPGPSPPCREIGPAGELYGEADHAERPLPDGLHPDAATHRRMGERFAELAFTGPFAAR
ncbi:hypothetical protein GCM10017786_04430 [Amycolatopsis deserti]|uniref:SGNH hydrolase-type esterase domain-containing protein n=1 Tax=Amycolatopsis deserti TaxID=185696 RepID=A0ABQ3IGK1_9PSEU|nr:hypothetical protein GCM10017786_04430 [Amycolatopsis deserti]